MAGYWKCLATVGPTLAPILSWDGVVFIVHWAHRIEDTNTLQLDVYIYLFTSSVSQAWGYVERCLWIIKTLTNGRKKKAAIKGLCGKETLWRGLCNNKNNYKSKLANINETLNQM